MVASKLKKAHRVNPLIQSLAPGLLVAPPFLVDSNFQNTLIALVMNEKEGSMGFVINKKSNLMLHDLVRELSIVPYTEDRYVLQGGPVSKSSGYLIYEHEPNSELASDLRLCDTISISPAKNMLEMAVSGNLPGRYELVLGYSGWGPGQLEMEIGSGNWLQLPFSPQFIFDVPMKERWNWAYASMGISPFGFISVPGGARA